MKTMKRFDRTRDYLYGKYEALFPAPAQVRLMEILGASVLTVGSVRHGNRQLTITLSRGKLLRSRRFRRAVVNGIGVLASDVQWAIGIEGPDYERQVIEAYERDEKLMNEGWRLMYVRWQDLWTNPGKVVNDVSKFLTV